MPVRHAARSLPACCTSTPMPPTCMRIWIPRRPHSTPWASASFAPVPRRWRRSTPACADRPGSKKVSGTISDRCLARGMRVRRDKRTAWPAAKKATPLPFARHDFRLEQGAAAAAFLERLGLVGLGARAAPASPQVVPFHGRHAIHRIEHVVQKAVIRIDTLHVIRAGQLLQAGYPVVVATDENPFVAAELLDRGVHDHLFAGGMPRKKHAHVGCLFP